MAVSLFRKILVANRGEIAVRIIQACQELGIKTVAIYSEADADSLHVRMADESHCVGPAAPTRSYLNVEAIMDIATRSQVEAIHPGYGFLAENAYFASVCNTWGIDFIGPSPESIEQMGGKVQARERMMQAGVPVIPGSQGALSSLEEAESMAEKIGYPVLIKASAGGGGRGIRVVQEPSELRDAFETASREAQAAFGDGSLFMEKYLRNPRHVEFQVMADRHGNFVHLWERDSSIQRRRQKLLEEAPCPILSPELRERMSEAAILAARAVHYVNAGTVEFLLDEDGQFYFIEMNTRIQVEHPTTEWITQIDLIKEQILVAAGEPLSFTQEDIKPRGWSIEFRINAEDPYNRFMPSPGTITRFDTPGGPGIRIDTGFQAGSTVQPFYDSLVAKLIVWGRNRQEALQRGRQAIRNFRIEGIHTTLPLHQDLLNHPRFQQGDYNTLFLEEEFLARRANSRS